MQEIVENETAFTKEKGQRANKKKRRRILIGGGIPLLLLAACVGGWFYMWTTWPIICVGWRQGFQWPPPIF